MEPDKIPPQQKSSQLQTTLKHTQMQKYPYNCIGIVAAKENCAAGVLISSYMVLTVAHSFIKFKQGQQEPIMVKPQHFCIEVENDNSDFKSKIAISGFKYSKEYVRIAKELKKIPSNSPEFIQLWKESQKYDYAILKLDREVKLLQYPTLCSDPSIKEQRQSISVCGYEIKEKSFHQVMYSVSLDIQKQRGLYDIGPDKGQSGSPVYSFDQQYFKCHIVGVHQGYDQTTNKNICTLITKDIIIQLREWESQLNVTFSTTFMDTQLQTKDNNDQCKADKSKKDAKTAEEDKDKLLKIQENEILQLRKQLEDLSKSSNRKFTNFSGTAQEHHEEGLIHGKAARYAEAAEQYRKAITLQPNNAKAHCNLGVALHKLKKYEDAIIQYKIALKLDPNYAIAYDNLGSAYADTNNIEQAIKFHRKSIQLSPIYAPAHFNLGTILEESKNYKQAIRCYWKVIELDPKNAQAYNSLGVALHKIGKFDVAIGCYHKAIQLDRKQQYPFGNLEWVLSQMKDPQRVKKEIDFFEKIAKLRPGNERVSETLMRLRVIRARTNN